MFSIIFLAVMLSSVRAQSDFHKEVVRLPVGELGEVRDYADFEKAPILATVGKDTSADVRLYIEASNPQKEKFVLFNIAVAGKTDRKVKVSFQAVFYDSNDRVIGVAGMGAGLASGQKTSLIAGMQHVPSRMISQIRSLELLYYEWEVENTVR
jgi:hypothetical protein